MNPDLKIMDFKKYPCISVANNKRPYVGAALRRPSEPVEINSPLQMALDYRKKNKEVKGKCISLLKHPSLQFI